MSIKLSRSQNIEKTLRKLKIEDRTTFSLNTYSSDVNLFPQENYVMQPGLFPVSIFLNKPAESLFLPKNNKVHVNWELVLLYIVPRHN